MAALVGLLVAFRGIGLHAAEDFIALHGYGQRRIYAQPNLTAFDTKYGDRDFIANFYGFTDTAREYEHKCHLQTASVHIRASNDFL